MKLTSQERRYRRLKEERKCVRCQKPLEEGSTKINCESCRKWRAEYQKDYLDRKIGFKRVRKDGFGQHQ